MPQAHALLLAVLLFSPFALAWWRRAGFHPILPAQDEPGARRALGRYRWAVAGAAAWLAIGVAVRALDLQHNLETATLLAIVIGCLLAAPSRPLAGPTGYALLSYTFGRDDTVTTTLMNLGGTSIVAALSVAAAVVWWRRHGGRLNLPSGWLGWSVAIFSAGVLSRSRSGP